jgi:tyrosine phenol-lyase
VDTGKLERLIARVGAGNIAYVSLAGTVNMAGGQPISMECVRALRALCDQHSIRIFLDATRMVENAFFIQEREAGYADTTIAAILREFCSYTDGAWMSAKKDSLVNIGGWLAGCIRSRTWTSWRSRCRPFMISASPSRASP